MERPRTNPLNALYPSIHFVGPWSEDEASALARIIGPMPPLRDHASEFGKPWVAVKEAFETFTVYCVSRAVGSAPFVAETLDDLATLVRAEASRKHPPDLFRLIYSSLAVEPFTDEALFELLRQARAKNESLGITGVLIYRDGRFAQLLEGEEPVVRALYARILEDDRHTGLTLHMEAPANYRLFPRWSMGFEHARGAPAGERGHLSMDEAAADARIRPVVEALAALRRAQAAR